MRTYNISRAVKSKDEHFKFNSAINQLMNLFFPNSFAELFFFFVQFDLRSIMKNGFEDMDSCCLGPTRRSRFVIDLL